MILAMLSKNMRERRLKFGALSSDTNRLVFALDDQGLPVDCSPYRHLEADNMVEEVSIINVAIFARLSIHSVYASCEYVRCSTNCDEVT